MLLTARLFISLCLGRGRPSVLVLVDLNLPVFHVLLIALILSIRILLATATVFGSLQYTHVRLLQTLARLLVSLMVSDSPSSCIPKERLIIPT